MNEVPAELPCTSLPQQWHKPRGSKIQPEPVSTMVFSKPKPTPRKKKPVIVDKPNQIIPDVYPEDITRLKADPQLPLSYLLQEDISLQQSICGNIQEGSMLKYHHFKDHPSKVDAGKCGDTVFPKIVKNIAVIEKYGSIVEMQHLFKMQRKLKRRL